MNKQEALKKIEKLEGLTIKNKGFNFDIKMIPKGDVLEIIEQIDEPEKLYTVELPNPNGDSNRYGLCKVDGRIIIGSFVFGLNKASNAKLTEAEIKKDFDWAWQFAKEVKKK